MYQKVISALLCLTLLLGLAGCGTQASPETTVQQTVSTEQSESSAPEETQESVSEDFDVEDEPEETVDFSKYEEKVSTSSKDSEKSESKSDKEDSQNQADKPSGETAQKPDSETPDNGEDNSQYICYFNPGQYGYSGPWP